VFPEGIADLDAAARAGFPNDDTVPVAKQDVCLAQSDIGCHFVGLRRKDL